MLSQASTLFSFIVLRVLLGLGEGPHFPAMTQTLTNWLPMKERARALGLELVGVPLASLIGAPLIASLIISFGWKLTFLILGLLGIGWTFFWFLLFRTHPRASTWVSTAECNYIQQDQNLNRACSENSSLNWKKLLLSRSLITSNIAFFAFGYLVILYFLLFQGY